MDYLIHEDKDMPQYEDVPQSSEMFIEKEEIWQMVKHGYDDMPRLSQWIKIYDINGIKTEENSTPLHEAIKNKNMNVINLLEKNGADFKAVDKNNTSILYLAAKQNLYCIVCKCINDSKVGVNVKLNSCGSTPLHIAAKNNSIRIAEKLMCSGANPNIKDRFGDTPIHIATIKDNYPIVKFCLAYNLWIHNRSMNIPFGLFEVESINNKIISADINIPRKNGETAIDIAFKNEYYLIFKSLLSCLLGPSEKTIKYYNVLLYKAIKKKDDGGVYELLHECMYGYDQKEDYFHNFYNGESLLHLAVSIGNMEIIKYLLYAIKNPFIQDKEGKNIIDIVSPDKSEELQLLVREILEIKEKKELEKIKSKQCVVITYKR